MIQSYTLSHCDRFIGPKSNQHQFGLYSLNSSGYQSPEGSSYDDMIRRNLFGAKSSSTDLNSTLNSKNSHSFSSLDLNLPNSSVNTCDKNVLSPVKILDVPNIKDDFYLNLIDWHEKGPLGVALNNQTYIYTPNDTFSLAKSPFNTYICSLKFNESIIAVGLSNGMTEIYDLQKFSLVRSIKNHSLRVSSLAFSQNTMISGSKDRLINFSDLRLQDCLIKSLQYHSGEVCSLKVKPDQKNVFASGANDNKVCIWDIRDNNPFSVIKGHQGAVKAISWCPWKTNTLATGGGKNDRTIKIWNNNGDLICKKELKSQISGLEWNKRHNCLVSSHGSNSNQVMVWDWNGSSEIRKINGSKNSSKRVLSLIQSKEEDMICTLSSDQTMKFYEFPDVEQQEQSRNRSKQNIFGRIL